MAVRLGLVLVGLTVLVAGCSSEQAPATLPPLPSAPASPSSATLPSLAVPLVPEAAKPNTSAAASAFATFFVTNIGRAFQQAEVKFISSYIAPGCGGCEALVASVRELAAAKQRRIGGEYLDIQAVSPRVVAADVVVSVSYRRSEAKIVNEDRTVAMTSPAVPVTQVQVRLIRRGTSWSVQGYRLAPS